MHVAPLLIGRVGTRIEIDAGAQRAQWPVLDQLLQGRAPHETMASGAAAPFLERRFELVRVDPEANGTPTYRLTGQERRGLGLWGAMTRFVGRREELDLLRSRLTMAAGGHGQVVAVVGEAGVGKSRLIYELAAAQRPDGWRVLEATAVSYGQSMGYLPVIALLKGYFAIQDRDELREVSEKVAGKLLTLDAARRPTLSGLLALLDVPVDDAAWRALDPTQRRQRTLDAVRRLLLREAREQPLLLIFEDLHWIDSETQALLDGLVETVGSARLLLLVSYRPEYHHQWGSKTSYSQLRMETLPIEQAGELLDALLGQDPDLAPLKQLLVKRGNPLFLEETVRTLVETQALDGPRGGYRLMQPVPALQIPPTVQAVLAARIDRLAPEDKRLLQTAAVIGKDVPFALLQAIADLPDESLRRGLDHLQAAEFLYETGLFPDPEYAFKHALTLEVAYGSLLVERRRALHAEIVGTVEARLADRLPQHVELLAHHAFRGEVWDKALLYLHQAGHKAASRSAHREAAACFDQALTVLGHLADSREARERAIDLRLQLRTSLFALGELSRIPEVLGEAEAIATAIGDRRRQGLALVSLSNHYFQIADSSRPATTPSGRSHRARIGRSRDRGPGHPAPGRDPLHERRVPPGHRSAREGCAWPPGTPARAPPWRIRVLACLCLSPEPSSRWGSSCRPWIGPRRPSRSARRPTRRSDSSTATSPLASLTCARGTSSAQSRRSNAASASLAPEAFPFWNPSCAPPWAPPMPSPGGSPRESRSSSWVWAEPPGWGRRPPS